MLKNRILMEEFLMEGELQAVDESRQVCSMGPHPVRSVPCGRYRQAEFETALARAGIAWPIRYRGTGLI